MKEKNKFTYLWLTCLVMLFGFCVYGLTTQTKGTYSSQTISGKWAWNDYFINIIRTSTNYNQSVEFTSCGNQKYRSISIPSSGGIFAYRYVYYCTNGSYCGSDTTPAIMGAMHLYDVYDEDGFYYDHTVGGVFKSQSNMNRVTPDTQNNKNPVDESCRYMDFGNTPQNVNDTFYNWFIYVATPLTVSHNVEYYANGGSGAMISDSVTSGDSYTIINNTFIAPSGKSFVKWCTKSDGTGTCYNEGKEITVSSDLKLYAQWKNAYTVTYYANYASDGSGPTVSDTVISGTNYKIQKNTFTAPSGKTFLYWCTGATGGGTCYYPNSSARITSNLKLYAQWKKNSFQISYDANGGTGTMTSNTVSQGATYTIRNNSFTAPSGKTFVKWCTVATGGGTCYYPSTNITVSSNLKLYAIWKDKTVPNPTPVPDPNPVPDPVPDPTPVPDPEPVPTCEYNVSYNKNTIDTVKYMPSTQCKESNKNLKLSIKWPYRFGYLFKEWNTSSDGRGGTRYDLGDIYTKNEKLVLYAIWEQDKNDNKCPFK